MPSTLVFPDGVRLALKHEIPGPERERSAIWERIESANIAPGFVIKASNDARFARYAEINVDAPQIWGVFRDLCHALLGSVATFIASEMDTAPTPAGSAGVTSLISILERHKYQLVHDGFLQFGVLDDQEGMITEVLVAPTKHFRVWLNDERRFRSVMKQHGLREDSQIQFLDEYPHTTIRPPEGTFREPSELLKHLENEIGAASNSGGNALH
jgi:hypothetical protein